MKKTMGDKAVASFDECNSLITERYLLGNPNHTSSARFYGCFSPLSSGMEILGNYRTTLTWARQAPQNHVLKLHPMKVFTFKKTSLLFLLHFLGFNLRLSESDFHRFAVPAAA
jgi:hypothetical protein